MNRWPTFEQKIDTFQRLGYSPFPLQQPVHESQADVIQIVGAEAGGKSYVPAMEITACVPWSNLIYLIGETYEQPRREFDYIKENLLKLGAVDPQNISTPATGKWQLITRPINLFNQKPCVIETLSVQNGATNVIALGEEPDIFDLAEAGIISSYSVFTACVRRATRSRGRIIASGTLKDNYGWYAALSDELAVSGNAWRGQTFALPAWANLLKYPLGEDDPEIQRLKLLTPEEEYNRTIAGKRVPSPALIFPEFSYKTHIKDCPFNPDLPITLWIDPGYFPSAYVVLPVQFYGPEVWIIDEVYLNHHTHAQVIDVCKSREWWKKVGRAVIDFAGRQHHAEQSAEEVWHHYAGIRPHSQQVGILDGISRHRSFLGPTPRLFHDPRCKGALAEYKQYKRKTDRDGNPTSDEPIDANNHSMKAIAYGLVDRFGFVERQTEAAVIKRLDPIAEMDRGEW